MKKVKKILGVLMATVMVVGLGGCGGVSDGKTGSSSDGQGIQKAITISAQAETGTLDPAGVSSYTYWSYEIYGLDELVRIAEDGSEEFLAAESYDKNDDMTQFTFHLRKDGKWSDGTPVTADDFINTFTRALDPECGSGYSDFLFIIKNAEAIWNGEAEPDTLGAKAIDDYTLQIDLNAPCAYFIDLLRLPVFKPSCVKYATETNGDWTMDPAKSVSNGPFRLKEFTHEQGYVLEKNPEYWNKANIKLDEIAVKFINDQQARVNAYKTGELDVASDLPYYAMDQYEGKDDLVLTNLITTKYLYPNVTVKPLDDVRVRKALNLAINREEVSSMVGTNTEPTMNFTAKYMIGKTSGKNWVEERDYPLFEENVEEAKKLLAESGYPNGEGFPVLKYNYPNVEVDSDTAQAVQAQWKKNLNIDVELVAQEMQVNISERRAHNFDISRMSWTADFSDPATYLTMHISNSSYNDNCVNDPQFDEIMANAAVELDTAKRNELLHDAEKLFIGEQFYLIPLYTMKGVNLVNPKITGIKIISANGGQNFAYADIAQ